MDKESDSEKAAALSFVESLFRGEIPPLEEKKEKVVQRENGGSIPLKDKLMFDILRGIFPELGEKYSERKLVEYLTANFDRCKSLMAQDYRRGNNLKAKEILQALEAINFKDLAEYAEGEYKKAVNNLVDKTPIGGTVLEDARKNANYWRLLAPVARHAFDQTEHR